MRTRNWQILQTIILLAAACPAGSRAQAKDVSYDVTAAPSGTSTYVFLSDQSTVVQTGGIAGVHRTYFIEGEFQLSVDTRLQTARFVWVHGTATQDTPAGQSLDLNSVLNLTGLVGAILPDKSIRFEGKAADNSDFVLTLTFEDDLVYLKGQTTPPPGSADFFIYTLDAVARKNYGGGTGEPGSPYLIYTAEQMNAIGDHPRDWDKHFKLMADIDLSDFLYYCALIAPDTNSGESGFQGTVFSGVFDGNGHTVSRLTITGTEYLGLFGWVGYGAEVENLQVVDVNITGSGGCVGGLAGYNFHGTVVTCSSAGAVSGDWHVGGLVGTSHGVLTGCHSTGAVSANGWHIGGLVGWNSGAVTACDSTASVSGGIQVGGLVGLNFGTISNSSSAGAVTRIGNFAGGLVGYNFGDVIQCYSTSGVNGVFFVGGLIGYNNDGHVADCYSIGNVASNAGVGGLIGVNAGDVIRCYSTGKISGNASVGGLLGENWQGTVNASFWDTQTSGQTTSAGGAGKTTAEMKTGSTFTQAGWDFENIWRMPENDYPRLLWELAGGGAAEPGALSSEGLDASSSENLAY